MSLFFPIVILALGALAVLLLSAVPRMRGLCAIAAGFAGLAVFALLRLNPLLPVEWAVSGWQPLALFGAPLAFKAAAGDWTLAAVLVATSFLSLIACNAGPDTERINRQPLRSQARVMALILVGTGVGVAALFANSFIALVVTWSALDILLAAALSRYGRAGVRRAGLALFSGVLATSALWAASLIAQAEGASGFLDLAHFSGRSASMLQVAVILRLGLVPLHLWRPIDLEIEPAQLIPWVVIPTLLGFDLFIRLVGEAALIAGLPSTLFALAALTVLVGGFVAWSETEERQSLAGVIVAETGLAVLAAANAGQQAVATAIAAAIAWTLSVTILALTPGWSGRRYFWRGLPSLLALFSLVGLPATLGFVVRFTTYSGLEADLIALTVALLGEIFVIAAILRLWIWAEPRPLPRHRFLEPVYLAIFMLAAAILLLTGLSPDTLIRRGRVVDTALSSLGELIGQGGVAGWAGWALPLVGGATLFVAGEGLRQRLEGGWRGLGALLRLEWIYGLFYLAIRQVARLLRGIASVVEGEGALLWTAVTLLIILLYLTGNGGL